MDDLRGGIGLRAFASKDPVKEYTREGNEMFDEMIGAIREDTAKMILGIIGLAVTFGPDVKRHFRDILDYIYQIVGIDHTTGRKDSITLWTFIIIFFLIPISAIYQRFIIDRSFSDLFESHSLFYYIWNVITLLFGFIFFICALLGIPVGIIYSFAALSNWISDVDRRQFPRR